MWICKLFSLFVVLQVLLVQSQDEALWPDFTCYPKYDKEMHSEMLEVCTPESLADYDDWIWSNQTKCPKTCLLNFLFILESNKVDKNRETFSLSTDFSHELFHRTGKNEKLTNDIMLKIHDGCTKELESINEKQLHCSEWDNFYSCVNKAPCA